MGITYEKAILMLAKELGEIVWAEINKVNTQLNKSNEKIAELEKEVVYLEKQVKFLTRGNFKPFHPTKR